MNTTMSAMVNRNSWSSKPRRVRNELSAAPNSPLPCPFTCTSIMTTSRMETIM